MDQSPSAAPCATDRKKENLKSRRFDAHDVVRVWRGVCVSAGKFFNLMQDARVNIRSACYDVTARSFACNSQRFPRVNKEHPKFVEIRNAWNNKCPAVRIYEEIIIILYSMY